MSIKVKIPYYGIISIIFLIYFLMYLSINAWDYTNRFDSSFGYFIRLILLPLLSLIIPVWQLLKNETIVPILILISVPSVNLFLFWLQGKVDD